MPKRADGGGDIRVKSAKRGVKSVVKSEKGHSSGLARDAVVARMDLRDRACAGLPGKGASEYDVRVRTACVPARGLALELARQRRSRDAANKSGVGTAAAGPTMQATRAEIRALEKELSASYPDPNAVYDQALREGGTITLSHAILRRMMDPRQRLREPDPVKRYNALTEIVRKTADDKAGFNTGLLQRNMVMRALLSHLLALAGVPPSKKGAVL